MNYNREPVFVLNYIEDLQVNLLFRSFVNIAFSMQWCHVQHEKGVDNTYYSLLLDLESVKTHWGGFKVQTPKGLTFCKSYTKQLKRLTQNGRCFKRYKVEVRDHLMLPNIETQQNKVTDCFQSLNLTQFQEINDNELSVMLSTKLNCTRIFILTLER